MDFAGENKPSRVRQGAREKRLFKCVVVAFPRESFQDGETGTLLTHPTRIRRDASFNKRRLRIARTLGRPHCVCLTLLLAAALRNDPFDHPAGN
jgi:hypothetical protein